MYRKTIIFIAAAALVTALASAAVSASVSTPTPPPPVEPLWDYWLLISSSNAAHGLVRVNGGKAADIISLWFYPANPWPEGGLTVEALPRNGYRFEGWYERDALVTTANPYNFIGKHINLVAQFGAVEVTDIQTLPQIYVVKGDAVTLPWVVSPENAAENAVTWSSANTKIAAVNNEGVVKGVKIGKTTVTVTAKDGKKTAKCAVNVVAKAVSVKKVAITPGASTWNTLQLNAAVAPANATSAVVKWKSSEIKVAKVDKLGKLTILSAGETIITATVGGKTAKYVFSNSYQSLCSLNAALPMSYLGTRLSF